MVLEQLDKGIKAALIGSTLRPKVYSIWIHEPLNPKCIKNPYKTLIDPYIVFEYMDTPRPILPNPREAPEVDESSRSGSALAWSMV